ncbi:hypothetical protein KB874_18245 [Aestuariicoccus sp. KMU-90]|uniref:Uncharacterized protein n=2 Tax=Thetidibacter halocola TaxID=2827239 RepID=A0A8J8B9Z1_9RHOB|nr:hypothetical protein [Thetidibacter halocola]
MTEPLRPMLMRTENSGAINEKVVEFTVNPEARDRSARSRTMVQDKTLALMAEQGVARDEAAVEKAAQEEGWALFNLGFGISGAKATFAENVLEMGGLSNVNTAMTGLGLFMAIWQVNMDLADGKSTDAALNAYKGMLSFGIGYFGTSAMQVGNIAAFAIDVALQEFGKAAWLARTDAWRQSYVSYYNDMNAGEEQARKNREASDPLRESPEEQQRRIDAQSEGGRTAHDWVYLITKFKTEAKTPEEFETRLTTEVNAYVARFWSSARFDEYASDVGQGIWGIGRGTSLTQGIRDALEDEHKTALYRQFREKIFPVVAHRIWLANLEARVRHFNDRVRPILNQRVTIEIGAYELQQPVQMIMDKPSGGRWEGTWDPAAARPIEITKIAMKRAGMPQEITLMLPGGAQTRPFLLSNDRATVVFGDPVTPLVTVYDRQETGQRCTTVTTPPQGESRSEQAAGPTASGDLHFAMSGMGAAVMGRFDSGSARWSLASPGAIAADGATMIYSAPRFEDIARMTACSGGFLTGDALAQMRCTVERRRDEALSDGTRRQTACTSQATLSLKGGWLSMGERMQYFPLDGEQGEILRNILKESIRRGVVEGYK